MKELTFRIAALTLSMCSLGCFAASVSAEDLSARGLAEFENVIRPLLVEHCIECHGPKKAESGLRLDARKKVLVGGDRGPAISLTEASGSLILEALRHVDGLEMPPASRLPEHQVAAVEQWIRNGAAWPEGVVLGGASPSLRSGEITAEERAFWSFQSIADPPPPDIGDAAIANPIDRFVLKTLRDAQLTPVGKATRREWIRRATFDLTGLPPTPEEVSVYLADTTPDADAVVIERLLDSPAYGERWGRHWLDVVRYADTAGETADYPTPLSYKYRNWVINAFNADMPYDDFVRQQIAGDLMAESVNGDPDRYGDMRVATGFIAISRRFGFDVENYHYLTIQDTIDVVGQATLGLTLGCARCHDHKFDPVNMEDYYAWYGVFDSTRYSFPGSEEKKKPYDLFPSVPPQVLAERQQQREVRLVSLDSEIQQLKKSMEVETNRTQLEARLMELEAQHTVVQQSTVLTPEEQIYGVQEQETPHDSRVQLRGELTRLGDSVARRNLDILGGELLADASQSGRIELANWITRNSNPLFARVIVNRIWQQHFGRGLVATENDFGQRGELPSHPQLLDWLATRFCESGYSVKSMHRLMMTSEAYHRSCSFDSVAAQIDPDSRLLWRFNRRRLSAEEIRDAMLAVSGQLDRSIGQTHPFPPMESWGFTQHSPFYAVYPTNRRSVYLMQQRLKRHPFLGLFDGADTNVSTARREMTTVPTQSLYLMNNEFVYEQADALAKRLCANQTTNGSNERRIELAYELAFARRPTSEELNLAQEFLTAYDESARSENAAWSALARTLLTRNEFLFVD